MRNGIKLSRSSCKQEFVKKPSLAYQSRKLTKKLNQSTSLLSQTCGTFIDTLENCMQLANSSLNQHNSQNSVTDAAILSSATPERKRTSSLRGHAVEDRYTPPTTNKYGIQTRYHNLEDWRPDPDVTDQETMPGLPVQAAQRAYQ
ncbi:putative pleckstrin-likey domain-containing family A member 8 [Apostichopus japonicus]|uniref:Putative pleckstrin-likey domain-containing family A member 8 n=1 Tax=Stichopus japonicus TaxID=307972 RepID=A0A2G8LGK9_STIJA|nr:putative pleckstrin-likey domain-containing family A member 8 [Apostichopus japonicus]